jgi:tetratricopeptide (TPR) repeat protein
MRISNFIQIAFLMFSVQTLAQPAIVDSTQLCLQSLLNGSGMHHQERFCFRSSVDLLRTIDDSVVQSELAHDTVSLLKLWKAKGLVLQRAGKARDAIKLYKIAIPIATRYKFHSAVHEMLLQSGRIHEVHANYDSSLSAYIKALDQMERVKDSLAISELYADLGWLYSHLQDTSKAMKLFKQSLELKERIGTPDGMARLLVYQGMLWADMYEFKKAGEFFSNGLRRCETDCPISVALLELSGRGRALLNQGKLFESGKVLQEVLALARASNDKYHLAEALCKLGVVDLKRGRQTLALRSLNEALVIARENEFNLILLNIYDALIEIYSNSRELDQLAEFQSLYIEQENRIYGEKVLIRISSVQAEFETREDAHLVQSQKELMTAQQKTLRLKRYVNIAIGVVLLILLGIVVLLYKMNRRRQIFNQNLDRMVHERTHELEAKQLELERVSSELGFEIETMHQQMKSQLSTLEGIYYLAEKEGSSSLSTDEMRELKSTIEELRHQMALMRDLRFRANEQGATKETGQLLG